MFQVWTEEYVLHIALPGVVGGERMGDRDTSLVLPLGMMTSVSDKLNSTHRNRYRSLRMDTSSISGLCPRIYGLSHV